LAQLRGKRRVLHAFELERRPVMSRRLVKIRIRGVVQGVGFRNWTERLALTRGVEGWVRNRRDGSVEAVFAGPEDVIDTLLEACRRGPASARVSDVEIGAADEGDLELRGPGASFDVLPTA
jgi:acylphosphatase